MMSRFTILVFWYFGILVSPVAFSGSSNDVGGPCRQCEGDGVPLAVARLLQDMNGMSEF